MSHKHHNHNPNYTPYSKPQQVAPTVVEAPVETTEEVVATGTVIEEPTVNPVVEPVVDPVATPEPENTEFLGVVTECARLNVRKEPSMDADVVTVLLIGSEVMVDKAESTEEFYKITTEAGVEGYCKKDFISI